MRKTVVGIDGLCTHEAYVEDEHWNGWECPWFTKSEVENMTAWVEKLGETIEYDPVHDAYVVTVDECMQEVFPGKDIDGMRLYPIGNGSWTWEEVEA